MQSFVPSSFPCTLSGVTPRAVHPSGLIPEIHWDRRGPWHSLTRQVTIRNIDNTGQEENGA